jgi:hypothetical protein
MRALRWILGIGAVVVVLLIIAIAAGAVWLNSYIHSAAFKADVESRASAVLGGAVQIDQIDFDIWNGVKLQGFETQIDHAAGQGTLQLKVAKVNCTYAWTELLSRRLQLTGITLDQPQIVLNKQPNAAPAPAPQPSEPASASASSGSSTSSTSSSAQGSSGNSLPFQFILDKARINNGIVSVVDASGAATVNLQGLNLSADTSGFAEGKDVTGSLSIADIALQNNLHITDFKTQFTYASTSGALTAKPFSAVTYSGNLAGDYQSQAGGASVLNLNGKGIDVAALTAATESNSSAKLTGTLDFQSKWRNIESGNLDGEGDFQLSDGKLIGVRMLSEIGSVLKIKELNEPVIKKAQAHFTVQDRQTQLTDLQVQSAGFNLNGGGTIGFDSSLNMNMVLILTRDTMNKLPKELAASFVGQQDGSGSISFRVTGNAANPQTDLPQRLLMQNTQIKNVINNALNKLFH